MASFSSILAWRIPWTEEPGRLHTWGYKQLDTTEHAHMFDLSTCSEDPVVKCHILQILPNFTKIAKFYK